MVRSLLFPVLIAMGVLSAGAADAGGQAAAIPDFNGITVALSPEAGQCNIRSDADFRERLKGGLDSVGLSLDEASPVHARLTVTGRPIASVNDQCVIVVSLAFTIPLEAKAVRVTEAASKHEAVIAIFKEIEEVPVVLYEDGEFTAAWPTEANEQALYITDQLAEQFGGQRK
jgi:hypothetical protein